MSPKLLKEAAPVISWPLATIFNYSLSSGEIPDEWKIAKVCPVYKDGPVIDTSNYRPISLLSICLKTFEKIVHEQLYNHLTINNLLSVYQSGFRPSHSTVTALIDVTDYILDNAHQGLYTGVVFLDLKKAFDTIDPHLLLDKLSNIGLRENEHLWFKNYLLNRNQCVSLNGVTSDLQQIEYGVPQGSVLGPLLFIIYINDLHLHVENSKVILYADDTALFYASKDTSEVQQVLQRDLSSVHSWLTANKLTLNVKKTKSMIFRTKKRVHKVPTNLNIKIDDEPLEQADAFKYLGIWFDPLLSWESHVNKTITKISQRLGIIRRIRNCLPQQTAKMLIESMILPVFDYGDVVWSNCNSTLLCKLERLLNRAGKTIIRCPIRTSSTKVRQTLGWPSLVERQQFHLSTMAYNCYHGNVPTYLLNCFTPLSAVHSHNTRLSKANGVFIAPAKNNYALRKFTHRGGNTWNSLPDNLKTAENTSIFKRLYKTHYLDAQPK